MSVLWRKYFHVKLVTSLFLSTVAVNAGDPVGNTLTVSGIFASTEQLKELSHVEIEIVNQFYSLLQQALLTTDGIKSYLDEWQSSLLLTGQKSARFGEKQDDANTLLLKADKTAERNFTSGFQARGQDIPDYIVPDSKDIVNHPVDAYLLVRRTARDLQKVAASLKRLAGAIRATLEGIEKIEVQFVPFDDDLKGAALALLHMQSLFSLKSEHLADGILAKEDTKRYEDLQSHGRLGVWDALFLASVAQLIASPKEGRNWLAVAAGMMTSGAELPEDMTHMLPQLTSLQQEQAINSEADQNEYPAPTELPKLKRLSGPDELQILYRCTCAGDRLRSIAEESSLRCRLERLQSPYLLLMPLRLEEASLSPRIVLYRDFLTDKQTQYFIDEAKPELEISEVQTSEGKTTSMFRISSSAFIGKSEHGFPGQPEDHSPEEDHDDFLTNLNKRIEHATGLRVATTKASEAYQLRPVNLHGQVVNYGIGGQYTAHTDYGTGSNRHGGRVATFLMYLSDVEVGGSTVFPMLGVGVRPTRGTALYWHNLLPSGRPYPLMTHAGCPVLYGNKWIATKWILFDEQFRRRPCGLSAYDKP